MPESLEVDTDAPKKKEKIKNCRRLNPRKEKRERKEDSRVESGI